MEPDVEEIEAVGNALITLNHSDYDEAQISKINEFLKSYTENYTKETLESVFEEDYELLEALKVLKNFVAKYKSNSELMDELKIEMDEILYNINDDDTSSFSI